MWVTFLFASCVADGSFYGSTRLGCDCALFPGLVFWAFIYIYCYFSECFCFFHNFVFLSLGILGFLELNRTGSLRCLISVSALQAVRFDCVCRLCVFLLLECGFLFYWRSFCGSARLGLRVCFVFILVLRLFFFFHFFHCPSECLSLCFVFY